MQCPCLVCRDGQMGPPSSNVGTWILSWQAPEKKTKLRHKQNNNVAGKMASHFNTGQNGIIIVSKKIPILVTDVCPRIILPNSPHFVCLIVLKRTNIILAVRWYKTRLDRLGDDQNK